MSPPVLELHSRVIQQPPNSAAVEFGVLSAELDLLEVSAENLLDPTLVAEFDREWEIVLDQVKHSMDLADLHRMPSRSRRCRR